MLFAYLFLVITSYVAGKATRDALFLDRFAAVKLPYADMAVSVLVGVALAIYIRVWRRVSLPRLLSGCLLFYASNCLLFWWLGRRHDVPWLSPVLYVWTGVFGALAPAQVWTLANYVLTPREAKRLFGLVGSGAIVGFITGGLLTDLLARRFGAESLLVGMAVALTICAALVAAIWREGRDRLGDDPERSQDDGPRGLPESLRTIGASPYLRAIAAVICLASLATSVAGWQFKAIAKQAVPDTDALAGFFGRFSFYAGIGALATQVLLTSRLLRRFGLGVALFVVPCALMLGSVWLLVSGTFLAAIALRGADQVLRYSIDKTSVELLFLPVPAWQKVQVKSFIDTVVWRFGDALQGLVVLVFAGWVGLAAPGLSAVCLVLVAGWMAAAWVARREYVGHLRESIYQHRIDAERSIAPVLDRAAADVLASRLQGSEPGEILYALSLFEVAHHRSTHPAVRGLLLHPSSEVRRRAIAILGEAGDTSVVSQIERLLYDPDFDVRTEALLYLSHHAHIDPLERIEAIGAFPDFSIRSAMVAFLARPGPAHNAEAATMMLDAMVREGGAEGRRARIEAARLIARLPDRFDEQLRALIRDPDAGVAHEAIRAVGALKKRTFAVRVIERLGEPELVEDATEALARFGDRLVGTLADYLSDPSVPIEIRREIPSVLLRIGTEAAETAMYEGVLDGDTILRFRVITALNKLRQMHPGRRIDAQLVETALAAEIMGHYRSYQLLSSLGASLDGADPVIAGLRDSMAQEVERIFRLLKLLFPEYDLHSAYFGLQSENRAVHDTALEFLENILKPQLRALLLPLVDRDVGVTERARLAARMLGAEVASREQAVATLVASDDPWLKSCAAYAIGTLGLTTLAPELDKWLDAPDPLLRETARQAREKLANG